jgi:tRNA(Ile2)-agmatinylcytidine synthase
MGWLGIDDTDSPRGGCTTFSLSEVVRAAGRLGFDLIGRPRLVRLNPNIPYKTRGNAALSARFGRGRGPARTIGRFPEGPVRAFARGAPLGPADRARLFEAAWESLERTARWGEPGTDPALVVSPRRLPASLYWRTVQEVVEPGTARRELEAAGALFRAGGDGRGLVGASAAVAWPGLHPTYELVAYRQPARLGRLRNVSSRSVARLASAHPELFLCTDPRTRRTLVAPHTACPVLYGLRSTRPEGLARLPAAVRSEPWERWIEFVTNQATGDHLVHRPTGVVPPFGSAVVEGTVRSAPETRAGGHVRFEVRPLRGGSGLECWAFEPTKVLPGIAAALRPGDLVRVWGGRADDPRLRLEGIEVLRTVPREGPGPNPRCEACGRRMESAGTGRGFRCRRDGVRAPPEARAVRFRGPAAPPPGRYHPTPSARRHLHPRAPEPGRPGESRLRWWLRRPQEAK